MEEEGGERGPNGGRKEELDLRILRIPALRKGRNEEKCRSEPKSRGTYVVGAWPSVVEWQY